MSFWISKNIVCMVKSNKNSITLISMVERFILNWSFIFSWSRIWKNNRWSKHNEKKNIIPQIFACQEIGTSPTWVISCRKGRGPSKIYLAKLVLQDLMFWQNWKIFLKRKVYLGNVSKESVSVTLVSVKKTISVMFIKL